ncbi:uncharacterized protein RB166_014351 [Leptodactylus fuscus]|uniref:uncharacterized protein LOC142214279 n=1 Tax=Leptodactylus fuscus TaxID=238119 RepID=UPI003F4E5E48
MKIFLLLAVYIPLCIAGQSPRRVFGILNMAKNLTTDFNPLNMKDVSWKREIDEYRIRILKVKNTVLENNGNRYIPFNNGTILGIKSLTKGDSGCYIADVTLLNNEIKEEEFILEVLDPVHPPYIIVETNGDRCNITLHCKVFPNTSDYDYIWKYRHLESDYQPYSNESSIQLKLEPNHKEIKFMCIVSNPADQKNISVHLENCSEKKKRIAASTNVFVIIVLTVVVVISVVSCIFQKKSTRTRTRTRTREGKRMDWHTYHNENVENYQRKYEDDKEYALVPCEDHMTNLQDERWIRGKEEHDSNGHAIGEPLLPYFDETRRTTVSSIHDEELREHVVEVHKSDEHEMEEHLQTCEDTREQSEEVSAHGAEERCNNGHVNKDMCRSKDKDDHDEEMRVHVVEVHETQEQENKEHPRREQHKEKPTHEVEEYENEEHKNEEQLSTPIEESREQETAVEDYAADEDVDEEHLTVPVEETHDPGEEVQTHGVEEHENHDEHPNESDNIPIVDRDSGDQDEGQADQNELKEHVDRDESKNNLSTPIQETGEQVAELQTHGDSENNEHVNEEHLTPPVEESWRYNGWQEDLDEDELKKHKKDEHLDEEENIINLLADTINQEEPVRIDEEEEQEKKDDHEIEEDAPLKEEPDVQNGACTEQNI